MGRLVLFGLRCLAWGYALQPAFLRRFWGRSLGAFLRVLKLRRGVVEENFRIAFPELEPGTREYRGLYRSAYAHLGHLVCEILMLLGPMRFFVKRHGYLKGAQNWVAADAKGRGAIFLSSHVGNWEVMAATGAIHGGMNLMIVTKHHKPEWLHVAIEKGRGKCGVLGTYEPRTMKDVLAHLKKGGTVGFVLDQYAGPPVGVRVPFFGVPVGTANVVAMLAKRTGVPVLPVVNYRTAKGEFIVDIRPPLEWKEGEGARALAGNTARYAAVLEEHVRAHRDQWLWIHRRFKGDMSPLEPGEWDRGRVRT